MPRTKQLIILFLVIVSGIFGSNCYSQNIKPYSFLSFVGLTAGHIGGDRQLSCEVVENVYKPARDVSFGGVLGFELDTSLNWFNQHSLGTTFGVGLALFTDIKNKGTVFQEGVFENLAYQYQSQNNALFAQIKKSIALKNNREISFLLGVGADLVISKSYSESPIDSSSITKSNTFKRHSQLRPAMVAGIYAPVNRSITAGYRVYIMGHGQLKSNLSCCANYNLKTTTNPIHAFIISYQFNK